MSLGLDLASAERIRAGMGFALSMAVTEGHTCIPEEELIRKTVQLLQLEYGQVEEVFDRMLQADMIRTATVGGQCLVYPEYLYRAEKEAARMLLLLRDHPDSLGKVDSEKIMADWERKRRSRWRKPRKRRSVLLCSTVCLP